MTTVETYTEGSDVPSYKTSGKAKKTNTIYRNVANVAQWV